MTTNSGPWSTAIHDHGKTQLATFWKHRFEETASADASRPASRLSSFIVVAVAILGFGLPPLLAEPEAARLLRKTEILKTRPRGSNDLERSWDSRA